MARNELTAIQAAVLGAIAEALENGERAFGYKKRWVSLTNVEAPMHPSKADGSRLTWSAGLRCGMWSAILTM